jgi:phage terminase Nu1 subunit (DNA packaging protein)
MALIMNREQFAVLTGVTSPAVRQWVVEGMPAVRTSKAGNAGYEIDATAALAWLFEKRIAKAVKAERRRLERRYNLVPDLDPDELAAMNESFNRSVADNFR